MPMPKWYVQTRDNEGQFRTVEGGEHEWLRLAYAHYVSLTDEPGVHMLLRGSHILLRSDESTLPTPASHDQLF